MIRSIRHKGLRLLYEVGSTRGVQVKHVQRLRLQLAALDRAKGPNDLGVPGWRLHPLKGEHAGFWSIWVDASWRLTFRFAGLDVELVDYADYH